MKHANGFAGNWHLTVYVFCAAPATVPGIQYVLGTSRDPDSAQGKSAEAPCSAGNQVLNAAGATILMITHDAGLADQLPRQIRMLDGQVVP